MLKYFNWHVSWSDFQSFKASYFRSSGWCLFGTACCRLSSCTWQEINNNRQIFLLAWLGSPRLAERQCHLSSSPPCFNCLRVNYSSKCETMLSDFCTAVLSLHPLHPRWPNGAFIDEWVVHWKWLWRLLRSYFLNSAYCRLFLRTFQRVTCFVFILFFSKVCCTNIWIALKVHEGKEKKYLNYKRPVICSAGSSSLSSGCHFANFL